MLSKEEEASCFRDPLFMPPGPMRDAAIRREAEELREIRKKANGPIVEAFKAGESVRKLAKRFKKTEKQIEEHLRRRLL